MHYYLDYYIRLGHLRNPYLSIDYSTSGHVRDERLRKTNQSWRGTHQSHHTILLIIPWLSSTTIIATTLPVVVSFAWYLFTTCMCFSIYSMRIVFSFPNNCTLCISENRKDILMTRITTADNIPAPSKFLSTADGRQKSSCLLLPTLR